MSRYHFRVCRLSLVLLVLTLSGTPATGQIFEDIYLVDSPTAGMLPHGGYLLQGSVGPRNGLLFGVKVGFYDRLMLGVSFGVQEFIGRGDVEVNDRPGFELRIRLIEESVKGPALALGIDTQGEDSYIEDDERYERKSRGFYAVLGKNYSLIGDFSIHGGVNYSLEDRDEEGVNFFAGLSMGIIPGFSLLLDYNAALDDNDEDVPSSLTRGKGYLDAGARFDYMDNLRIRVLFKDLLGNYEPERGVARSIEIFYINYF